MSDDLPPLDDFENELKQIKYNKPKDYGSEDYAKPDPKYMDEQEQKKQIEALNKKVEDMAVTIEKKKEVKAKQAGEGFGGFKKGFLGGGGGSNAGTKPKPKQAPIPQIKASKKNPLQIKQVQQAMKMNSYLDQTRSQWMTQNFIQKVTSDSKISVLFTNPQYMKAIDLFKTNPKEAMARYGQNKEFMEAFQEFCKMMGMQFQNLAAAAKK